MDAPKARDRSVKTLSEQEIVTRTLWDRRGLMRTAAAAAAATVVAAPAAAQGISDRDSGPGADPAGRGRHARTGVTDQDAGANSDPVNGGRGGGRPQRPQTGITDRDAGAGADPPGGGRGGAGSRNAGITDSDAGAGADPPGHGRGRGRAGGGNDRDVYERPWNADSGSSDQDPNDPYGHGRRSGQGPTQSRLSDNDTGAGSDPQGEGRGTAAWARRHQQGPTGGRPPQGQARPRQGDSDSRDSPAGDIVDVGMGRNDAARFLTDVQDSNALTRRAGRNDAALAGRTLK